MEVSDIHIGKQLQVNFSPQGSVPVPCAASFDMQVLLPFLVQDFLMVVYWLSPIIQPLHTVVLQVSRPDPISNPLVFKAPSIVHIRGLPPPASTPIDVVIGDPLIQWESRCQPPSCLKLILFQSKNRFST